VKKELPVQDKNQHLTDQQLLHLYRDSNNNHYLGILLQRYTLLLLGVCMKYLKDEEAAKDAVQQVFIKALNEAGKYEITYFKSWIYTVARNYCLMELRKNHYTVSEDSLPGGLPDGSPDPLEERYLQEKKEQMLQLVEQGLEQLQDPQKICVRLFYLEKNSYQQIAERTGQSLMQVKSAIQNGKRNIKIWVEKQRHFHAS
jgi:RNA polymerase sigma-70 factor (ECF subfamily)